MSSSLLHSRLPLKLTALQTPPVGPVALLLTTCELPETTAGAVAGVATGRSIDLIHHQTDQPQSFGDFGHGSQPTAVHQVNLPFSYYRSKGTPSLPRWRRGTPLRETRSIANSLNRRSTSCAFPYHYNALHHVNPKGTT